MLNEMIFLKLAFLDCFAKKKKFHPLKLINYLINTEYGNILKKRMICCI